MCTSSDLHKNSSKKSWFSPHLLMTLAILLGLAVSYFQLNTAEVAASIISELFINFLKLVSLPIIFLSIVSTASGMDSVEEIKTIGGKVLKYTLLTTLIAAVIALLLFVVINPVRGVVAVDPVGDVQQGTLPGYFNYLIQVIPSNIVQPFSENNVIGVLLLAMVLSFAMLTLPNEKRKVLHSFFSSLYAAVMKITTWIIAIMPIAVWAFVILFIKDLRAGLEVKSLAFYLICILAANLIQAAIVLPAFLKRAAFHQ